MAEGVLDTERGEAHDGRGAGAVAGTQDDAAERDAALPDVDWRGTPAGSRRWSFAAPSGALATLSAGPEDGPRVVLVPGVTGSKEDFRFQIPVLAAAGYRVESFDLAGQYESWRAGPERLRPPRRRYDLALFVDDLVAFLTAGPTPVHLLGYSFAGVLAQMVAAERPELITSLTLLSTPPMTGQVFRGVRRLGPISRIAPASVITAAMRWGILANTQHVPPGRQRFVEQRFALTRPDGFRQVMHLLRHVPDVRAAVRAAPFPVAVAAGDADLWPLRLHRRFADRLGARLLVYPAGHSPCETSPFQLSRDLIGFFQAATPSRARP